MPNPAARFDIEADDRTKAAFKSVHSNLTRAEKGFNTLKKVAFSLGTVAGLGYVVQRSLDTADALAKSADAADISTTALQELRFAAKQSGVEINQLDDGTRRFTRRLGLAADGGGPAVKAFEALDVSIKNTDGSLRNTEVILNDTINRLAAMDNQARRSALASQLFGDDAGPKLSLLLAQGTEGIAELRQEAHRLGLVLDEDAIRNAERAGDQLDILKQKLSTGLTAAVIENAESLEALADALIRVVDWFGKASSEVVEFSQWLGDELAATLHGIADDDLVRLEMKLQDINEELNTIGNNKFEFSDLWTSEATKKALEEEKQLLLERIELARQMQDQQREQARLEQQLAGGGESGSGQGDAVSPRDEAREKELEKQREHLSKKFETLRQHLTDEATLEVEKWWEKQELLDEAKNMGLITEQERMAYREELEAQHLDRLTQLRKSKLTDLEKFNAMNWQQQTKTVVSQLTQMTAGVAQHSKTMFEINKVAGIANAIINTSQGITQALSAYPPPYSIAMAAVQAAAGFAQVAAIKSQSFNGGGSGTAPSLAGSGGGSSTVNTVPALPDNSRDQEPRIRDTVIIQGVDPDKMFTGQQMRDLIERVVETENTGVSFA